ncbi:amidohydrolase family protein [Nannocystis sp. ILAH1]|uniref:amidohydrolase family protein n=1 Tax=unclassified Nannocystis TaxID=2627009 RepID=UPI00226ECFA3|nr:MULTISPECIES: amidohydrolase family protein [unclassified Nannocystis]MCY0989613.1 amidohydrolase family protein [Nannocystis sp. ILAH1]MCY1071287.1 amidohydrolase family protein [Nannocystis sp. RBIL2]
MIIDGHAHLSQTSYGSLENYVAVLKESGIEGAVVSPGGMIDVRWMNNFVSGNGKAKPVARNNYVAAACRSRSRFWGIATVNPESPRACEELEEHLAAAFRGLVVSPIVHKFSFGDRCMDELAALCGDRQVPVVSHIGWRPGANTSDFVALARRHPRTNFILEHMGAPPADGEATGGAAELDNFFVDTSLGSYLHIRETLKRVGASKVIFGSEYPLSHPGVELKKILFLPLPEHERDKILGGNIRALLRLDTA